ncbi:hypothetical protein [Pseudomonas sp. NPDC096950]|uniref:hypothetical protein n=1 Tax=Pseudomonas sp. NPDC096950 TaxID=3364485 RepID=UPI00383A391B
MDVDVEPTPGSAKKWLAVLDASAKLLAVIVVGGLAIAGIFGIKDLVDQRAKPDDGLKSYAVNLPRISVPTFRETTYREQSTGLCDGDETICTTLISTTPAESLQSLIAAIPKGDAKRYKIQLAVVPIEEFDETLPEAHGEPVLTPMPTDSH